MRGMRGCKWVGVWVVLTSGKSRLELPVSLVYYLYGIYSFLFYSNSMFILGTKECKIFINIL